MIKTINNLNKKEIPHKAEAAEEMIKEIFHYNRDMEMQCFNTRHGKALVVSIDGLSNKDLIDRDIIRPLKSEKFDGNIKAAITAIFKEEDNMLEVIGEISKGNVAIFYDNYKNAIIVDFKQWLARAVEQPDAEAVTRGPKEGFNENFRTNTAMIRRKVKSPDLIFENHELGKQTKTAIAIIYIKGIVNKQVLKQVRKKIKQINIDSILETGHIEQLLDDNTFSPISGMGLTQKPDILANKILEGRVAILCDGTPHVLIIPELFIENLQTADDYYNRVLYVAFSRLVRLLALFTTVILPGLLIAVFTFDQQMIPAIFLNNLIASTQKTPLPTGAEIMLLVFLFELLRESGTRLPRTVGNAVSIVGALIIGEAAVSAGLVSAPAVIIVALMAVSGFVLPSLNEFIIFYRFIFIILGGSMGLVGLACGYVLMIIQLSSTESFGIPILSSFNKEDLKDSVVRFPLKLIRFRPKSIAKDNVKKADMA